MLMNTYNHTSSHTRVHISSLGDVYSLLVKIFLAFLPWSTVLTVFLTYKLHIPGASFIKEAILAMIIGIFWYWIWDRYRNTRTLPLKIWNLDYLIFGYIAIMVVITIFTTGVKWLIYGGRYDFVFLVVLFVTMHSRPLLKGALGEYIKIFLISSWVMLCISFLLKWPLTEDLLLYLGYSPNISAWDFGWAPPIFHGIDWANVRRFQGLLDWPNTMGAFLILYAGILAYYFRYKKDWYFVIGLIIFFLVTLSVYTYSRSALIGIVGGIIVALAGGIIPLFTHYRKQVIALSIVVLVLIASVYVAYTGRWDSIVSREWSTKWHAERMAVGVNRTLSQPLGQGLGSAGPAYRYVNNLKNDTREQVEQQDRFYIPESWYIQQFIEGWILGGIIFLGIMVLIFLTLFSIHPILAGMFAGIGIMNTFLHTFESSVLSMALFGLIGIIFAYKKYGYKTKDTTRN